jgi:hypothetical protein
VDTKIRDHLWFQIKDPEERGRMTEVALALSDWDISGVSRRLVHVPEVGIVSGHDGERLSVLAGGLLGLASAGDAAGTAAMEEAIDRELRREAAAFVSLERHLGGERDLLLLAATLTHNVGDVDQGLSARKGQAFSAASRERFGRLAHERPERYGGVFARAARLYRELMASEGHRHYPLRDVRPLRSHPDLLLPIGPFLDEWGERLATFEPWTAEDRGAAVAALVGGIRRVKGQVGYFRALAGFDRRHPGGLASTTLGNHLPASVRRGLKDKELRKRIAIQRTAFESGLAKEARRILGGP